MSLRSLTRWRLGAVVIAAACGTAARGDVVIQRCMVSLGETGEAKVAAEESWAHLAVEGTELYVRDLKGLSAYRWK